MTCKDKFYEDSNHVGYDHRDFCPNDCGYLPNPEYCKEGADEEVVCEMCWLRELPDKKEEKSEVLPPTVAYICDRRACLVCSYPMCRHTTDIRHAVNFEHLAYDGNCEDKYFELEYDT